MGRHALIVCIVMGKCGWNVESKERDRGADR